MNPARTRTILACPLEWGLGHAVRLVPLIDMALRNGHRVVLVSDGRSMSFLRNRFPQLPWVRMPFYPVSYSDNNHFFRKLIPQIPGILKSIRKNHRQIGELARDWKADLILSDHRYGMTCPGVPSVFITNQLWLKAPKGFEWAEWLVYRLHLVALRKFTRIWLPDHPGSPNLSGIQTHPGKLPRKARYIGLISRFKGVVPEAPENAGDFHSLGLISGPEPQRTIIEKILTHHFLNSGIPAVILRGMPAEDSLGDPETETRGCVKFISHLPDAQLLWYINQAEQIICRPGNSTLADLVVLGKKAILVPTPGQTEQEYVADHLAAQGWFMTVSQKELAEGKRKKETGKSEDH